MPMLGEPNKFIEGRKLSSKPKKPNFVKSINIPLDPQENYSNRVSTRVPFRAGNNNSVMARRRLEEEISRTRQQEEERQREEEIAMQRARRQEIIQGIIHRAFDFVAPDADALISNIMRNM
jgi:hypothetical protein